MAGPDALAPADAKGLLIEPGARQGGGGRDQAQIAQLRLIEVAVLCLARRETHVIADALRAVLAGLRRRDNWDRLHPGVLSAVLEQIAGLPSALWGEVLLRLIVLSPLDEMELFRRISDVLLAGCPLTEREAIWRARATA